MIARIFVIVLLVVIGSPALLQAQDDDRRSRLEKARAELDLLRRAAEAVPEPERRPREELADPYPEAVDLIDRILAFAKSYEDLPVAARARLLLPELHRKNVDPAAQAAALRAQAEADSREGARAGKMMEAAALLAEWGAFAAARTTWTEVEGKLLGTARARFEPMLESWRNQERRRGRDLGRALGTIAPDGSGIDLQGRNRSQVDRVLASLPAHAASRRLLEMIVPRLDAKAPRAARRFYLERLLLFHPESEAAGEIAPALVRALALDGDYERAWHHHRAAARRGRPALGANEAKALTEALARVKARRLDLPRNTRRLRALDLRRRAGRGEDGDELIERYRFYAADYPQSGDLAELGWVTAKAAFADAPEDAAELTRQLLARDDDLPFRFEALTRLRRWLEENEDQEAVAALLEAQAPRLTDPRQRASVALDRAGFLADEDRLEDAIALLEPLVAETKDPVAKKALTDRITALRKDLD